MKTFFSFFFFFFGDHLILAGKTVEIPVKTLFFFVFFWRSHQFSDQTAAFSPSILDFTQPEFRHVGAGPGPTFGSRRPLRPGNTALFEQLSQWWRTVGNTVFDLIGQRFESQTSRSRNERVTARPTGWSRLFIIGFIVPLRPWILFVAYRLFFSAWIVLNKSLTISVLQERWFSTSEVKPKWLVTKVLLPVTKL